MKQSSPHRSPRFAGPGRSTAIWLVVPLLVACGAGKSGTGPGGDDPLPQGCDDPDGDGFGRGADCAAPDCDESDALRHEGCPELCSSCDEACYGGEGCAPLDPGAGDGLVGADEGGLTVSGESGAGPSLSLIWIANTAQGSISKVDTRTHQELGRYFTGLNHQGDSPSRTSVDYHGDVVVANRAFGLQASVTRILAGPCPDRDGDGVVRTSTGRDDLLAFDASGPSDECIAWRTEVGCADGGDGGNRDPQDGEGGADGGGYMGCGIARSLTVQDRSGLDGVDAEVVWVGLFNEQKYVELDRRTGAPTGVEVDVAPCTPYGAAVDRDGRLWSACLSSNLASFDTASPGAGATVIQQPGSNYGITVDEHGHVWTGGSVTRYDPATRTFLQPGVDGDAEACNGENGQDAGGCFWEGQAYGSAIAADGQGSVWVGACGGGVCRVREDGDTLTLTTLAVGNGAYGMAVDFDGKVWGIGMGGNNAAVIDPDTESFELVLNDCEGGGGGGNDQNPDGGRDGEGGFGTGCLMNPYTYSDMTGFQNANAQDPRGSLPLLFDGCADGPTSWRQLVADADVPAGTSVTIEARGADTSDGLAGVAFVAIGALEDGENILDLSAIDGAVLELRITLRGHGGASPVLHDVHAGWSCEEVFG